LAHIDEALEYTPTVIDLHLTKARIYKHAGDLAAASDECEVARKMDLADRFLNTMSTRYLLRAGSRSRARSLSRFFLPPSLPPSLSLSLPSSLHLSLPPAISLRESALRQLRCEDRGEVG